MDAVLVMKLINMDILTDPEHQYLRQIILAVNNSIAEIRKTNSITHHKEMRTGLEY